MKAIAQDFSKAPISKQDKVMLHYAKGVTLEPYNTRERQVEALRRSGFSDRDIFDINQVTAYFNYVNRIADGLGVMLEQSDET